MITWCMIGILTALAFYWDIRFRIIPNSLTVSGAVIGIIYHLYLNGAAGLLVSVCGLCLGFILFYILFALGALGAGDVKLFAAFGSIAGMEFVLQNMVYSILYAGLIGLGILIYQKKLLQRSVWMFQVLFSFLVLKEWKAFNQIQKNQLLRFPFMWAVMPAIITYGCSLKGMI